MKKEAQRQEPVFFEAPEFCGTENYYRVSFGVLATDGAMHALETLRCFWLADMISSHLPALRKRHADLLDFLVATAIVKDRKAKFTLDDGNGIVFAAQKIPFTDLAVNVRFFVCQHGRDVVIMLPSEN